MNNICGGGCDKEIDLEQDHAFRYVLNQKTGYRKGIPYHPKCFCGKQKVLAFNKETGIKAFASRNDIIEFLEFEKENKAGDSYTREKVTTKGYDYIRDYQIISMNSAILTQDYSNRNEFKYYIV